MQIPTDWTFQRGFNILGLTHGIASNVEDPLFNPIYFEPGEICSQYTNWGSIEEIEFQAEMDSCFLIHNRPKDDLEYRSGEGVVTVRGSIETLESAAKDRRWTLLGNLGLWFRHALASQERNGLFCLHAAAIYEPAHNHLIIVVGGAGSGKSVLLLEAISKGYQVFSTEMTYFRLSPQGIRLFRGAMHDNIRAGTLTHDFPNFIDQLGVVIPSFDEPWDHKLSVDLQHFSTAHLEIDNPTISLLFPRIERGVDEAIVGEISDTNELARRLFTSASEKIAATFLLYDSHPIGGFDRSDLATTRWQAISELIDGGSWHIRQAKTILSGPHQCMEGIE